jgi:predicted dehydrogenase
VAEPPIRVAVIGLGLWGARAHLPTLAAMPEFDVRVVVDPRADIAEAAAERYGVPRVETDAANVFRERDFIDAVIIATPDDTHRDLTLAAFDAGLHVLCEKPLARDLAEGAEMVAAAARAGKVAKLGFSFRFSPVALRMHELVSQGAIGDVQLFEHIGVNAQFMDPLRPLHWKMQRERANGGVYVEYGAHPIDLALWFGGPMRRVVAHGATLVAERPLPTGGVATVETDDVASWIGEYASGGQALFRAGWANLPAGSGGVLLYGSKGTLHWRQHSRVNESLLLATVDDPEPRVVLEFAPPVDPALDSDTLVMGIYAHYNRNLAESFLRDIRAGATSWPTFADGLAAQRVLAAIRTSLDASRWVDIAAD